MKYDLLVIGNDQEGIQRAISAARTGRLVAIVETPVKAPTLDQLREAANNIALNQNVSMQAWRAQAGLLREQQTRANHADLDRYGVERFVGVANLVSDQSAEIQCDDKIRKIFAAEIVIGCGTRSRQPAAFRIDQRFVLTAESLLELGGIPQSAVVIGAGATGVRTAILLARLGVEVTVVDEHVSVLELYDAFGDSFVAAQALNIAFRLGDEAIGIRPCGEIQVSVSTSSGRSLIADVAIVCVGREGETESLNLESVGIGVDERGRLWCDDDGQTWVKPIKAVGDVIGFHSVSSARRTVAPREQSTIV